MTVGEALLAILVVGWLICFAFHDLLTLLGAHLLASFRHSQQKPDRRVLEASRQIDEAQAMNRQEQIKDDQRHWEADREVRLPLFNQRKDD